MTLILQKKKLNELVIFPLKLLKKINFYYIYGQIIFKNRVLTKDFLCNKNLLSLYFYTFLLDYSKFYRNIKTILLEFFIIIIIQQIILFFLNFYFKMKINDILKIENSKLYKIFYNYL